MSKVTRAFAHHLCQTKGEATSHHSQIAVYCLATSRSIVNLTSSPTTDAGNFVAIPNAVRLIVVVAENPE